MTVATLCEQDLPAEVGEIAWLWSTCAACNAEARRLVGAVAPPRYAGAA